MNYKNILSVTLLVAVVGIFSVLFQKPWLANGSVSVTDEYQATTTDSNWNASSCKPGLTNYKTLGSVLVTLTSNAPLEIYDATTTGPHADHATTSVVLFRTTTVGEYTVDASLKRGLCVVGASTVGVASTTITVR